MIKRLWDFYKELLGDILIVILSADLLYLYFAGHWAEPIKGIRVAELTSLCLIAMLGVERLVRDVVHLVSRKRNQRRLPDERH